MCFDHSSETGFKVEDFVTASAAGKGQGGHSDDGTPSPRKLAYCSVCGAASVAPQYLPSEQRSRDTCGSCGHVVYENPRIVVRCLGELNGSLLLCQRDHLPRRGLWSLPGGYVENGETLERAALREVFEETGARLAEINLFGFYEIPQMGEVVMVFRGHLLSPDIDCGPETQKATLFNPSDLPWNELAFPSDREALKSWLSTEPNDDSRSIPHSAEFFWSADGLIRVKYR